MPAKGSFFLIPDLHISHARQHFRNRAHRTEFFHLPHLGKKILKIKLGFEHFFGHPCGLFLIKMLLSFFNKGDHIAHAKNTGSQTVGMKNFQFIYFFTRAHKFNRSTGYFLH